MRRLRVVAVMALVSSCGTTTSNVPRTRMSAKDIVQRSSPAIVRIEAGGDKVGTGFIVDKVGIVATNLHVVAGESAIRNPARRFTRDDVEVGRHDADLVDDEAGPDLVAAGFDPDDRGARALHDVLRRHPRARHVGRRWAPSTS